MWLKILLQVLPVERIVAACLDYLLNMIEKKRTPEREKQVKKVIEAAVAFKDSVEGATNAKDAIKAWAKGLPTPVAWKGKSE